MKKFLKDESGATAIEYALIASAMGICLIFAVPFVAGAINNKFTSLATHIENGT